MLNRRAVILNRKAAMLSRKMLCIFRLTAVAVCPLGQNSLCEQAHVGSSARGTHGS